MATYRQQISSLFSGFLSFWASGLLGFWGLWYVIFSLSTAFIQLLTSCMGAMCGYFLYILLNRYSFFLHSLPSFILTSSILVLLHSFGLTSFLMI